MKQLTKKQKIDFCEYYLDNNQNPSGFYRQYVCDEIADFFNTYEKYEVGGTGVSQCIKNVFPELYLFNRFEMAFDLSEPKGTYIEENDTRITVISFVLAILKSKP